MKAHYPSNIAATHNSPGGSFRVLAPEPVKAKRAPRAGKSKVAVEAMVKASTSRAKKPPALPAEINI